MNNNNNGILVTAARNVLVVDDEPQILTSIEDLLEDSFDVLTVNNAEDALTLLQKEEVAVILTDQRMPGMKGNEFLERARQLSSATRIMFTGYTDMEALIQAVNRGQIYAYLSKPWDPADLRITVANAAEHYALIQKLDYERRRLQGLVKHLPEGVCLLNGKHRVSLANPAGLAYLHILGDTGLGNSLRQLQGVAIETFLTPRGDGLPHEIQIAGRRIFEVLANPLEELPEGGWVLVIRDVTEVHDTRERVQEQYRLASIGQLAAGIAHDFNNLLTVMMGTAQIMEMDPNLPDVMREDLQHIVIQGQRAAQLVGQVLDFSRQRDVECQPVNLVPFMKELIKLFQRILPESIQIESHFDSGDYTVSANLTQLQQILTNLAVNAQHAMPDGGFLTVRLANLGLAPNELPPVPQMESGDWVVWTVQDTGCGIPEEALPHIFEPFFTTRAPGEGTGLGLAQTYGIIKKYGGHIAVDTTLGEGTMFTIYLPRIVADMEGGTLGAELPMGHGETVLVVEDDKDVLRVAVNMLEGLNYRVLTATDGEQAQYVYDAHHQDVALVLTDMVMPKMNGLQLSGWFRKRKPELPIVIISGYPLDKQQAELEKLGVQMVLEKPLSLNLVAETLYQALQASV